MRLLYLVLLLSTTVAFGQKAYEEAADYQAELNEKFTNPETSILTTEDFEVFEGLAFYPIDTTYRVEALLVRTPHELPFRMPTTTDRRPEYVKYGELHFTLQGQELQLDVFQASERSEAYRDILFLPFTDATSGEGSYGGGRYIDITLPGGDFLILDFNQSYNPYCTYNSRYSCPIPPRQNHLSVAIEVGVKDF